MSDNFPKICIYHRGPDKTKKYLSAKLLLFSYPSVLTFVLGAQKNRLIETVLLSTHNICFSYLIRKLIFNYMVLSRGLSINLL